MPHKCFDELVALGPEKHRYWYDIVNSEIIVKAPLSPIYAACLELVTVVSSEVQECTRREGFACHVGGGGTGTMDIYDGSNKIRFEGKEGDGCVDVTIPGVEPSWLPHLIIESGYSEPYKQLQDDAKTWLLDYDKEVLAVILIKISKRPEGKFDPFRLEWFC